MIPYSFLASPGRGKWLLAAFGLAALLLIPGAATPASRGKLQMLRIGTSGMLSGARGPQEEAGLKTLHAFIEEETGLSNEILHQKSWQELAQKMAKGDLEVGVFQGFEFAWAVQRHPQLRPLAMAVNVYRYPVAYVVARRNDPARTFADLKGQSIAMPATGQGFLRLFVDRQAQASGAKPDKFFSQISEPDNVEDALDALVDGKVQAVVADRAALEAYRQRKPGRFKQLKEIMHSQQFPPAVVACYDSTLDQSTLQRFGAGLLGAAQKETGQTLLTLFRLSRFETIPSDFDQVLAATRKAYPPTSTPAGSK